MTDFTPTPEAVEAVAKTLIHELTENEYRDMADNGSPTLDSARNEARAAIAAFVEAEGLTLDELAVPSPAYFDEFSATDYEIGPPYIRVRGPWRKRDEKPPDPQREGDYL